jgi:hypothetical protein
MKIVKAEVGLIITLPVVVMMVVKVVAICVGYDGNIAKHIKDF